MQYVHWIQPLTSFFALQSSVPLMVQKYGNPPMDASPTLMVSATPVIVPSCSEKTLLHCSNPSPAITHICPEVPSWSSVRSTFPVTGIGIPMNVRWEL